MADSNVDVRESSFTTSTFPAAEMEGELRTKDFVIYVCARAACSYTLHYLSVTSKRSSASVISGFNEPLSVYIGRGGRVTH